MSENYWQFRYRVGQATIYSHVRADSKEQADERARSWCNQAENRVFCGIFEAFSVNGLIEQPKAESAKVKVG